MDDANPWQHDVLDRKSIADYLTPVVANIRQPFVIALQAPFGTGKTVFLKCWERSLNNDGYLTLYVNSWETEISENALLSLMATIQRGLAGHIKKSASKAFTSKAKSFAKAAAPLLAKGLARKALGPDLIDGLNEVIDKDTSSDIVSEVGERTAKLINAEAFAQDAIVEFREELYGIIGSATSGERGKDKIILLIDELDRCRPEYAIKFLECIKHLFAVPNILFIIAVDESQLEAVVKSQFGPLLNADGYLRRFIDWKYTLPEPNASQFSAFLCKQFALEEIRNFQDDRGNIFTSLDAFRDWFSVFSGIFALSLREQRQCFTEINLSLRSLDAREAPFSAALAALSVLRLRHRDQTYRAVWHGEEIDGFLDFIDSKVKGSRLPREWSTYRAALHSWLLSSDDLDAMEEKVSKLSAQLAGISGKETGSLELDNLRLNHEYYRRIHSMLEHVMFSFSSRQRSVCQEVLSRLDRAGQFVSEYA